MPQPFARCLPVLLAACAAAAVAAPVSPTPSAKPASGPSLSTQRPDGAAPAAGGNGGGLSSNGGNTAGQVKPKLPKCPDPGDAACKAVQVPAKK